MLHMKINPDYCEENLLVARHYFESDEALGFEKLDEGLYYLSRFISNEKPQKRIDTHLLKIYLFYINRLALSADVSNLKMKKIIDFAVKGLSLIEQNNFLLEEPQFLSIQLSKFLGKLKEEAEFELFIKECTDILGNISKENDKNLQNTKYNSLLILLNEVSKKLAEKKLSKLLLKVYSLDAHLKLKQKRYAEVIKICGTALEEKVDKS